MKRVLFIIILNLAWVVSGLAQSYVIDILYGRDSVACAPVIPEGKKFKNKEEASAAKQKVYLHNGDAVKVTGLPADSLRLRDFMKNNGVEIAIGGKNYNTSARNIILADTTGAAVDAVNGMLQNKPCLFKLDIHGKHRYLFNYGIIIAMLVVGLFGAFLTLKAGRIGFIFLIVPLLYFTWFTLHCGWDSYWFINPKVDDSRYKIYLIFILAAAFAAFAVKAVWNLYDDDRDTEHRLGLIAAPFMLPILYITVWGGLMTQWFLLLVAFLGYGYIVGTIDGGYTTTSGELKKEREYWKRRQDEKEKEMEESAKYRREQYKEQEKAIKRWNKEHGLY